MGLRENMQPKKRRRSPSLDLENIHTVPNSVHARDSDGGNASDFIRKSIAILVGDSDPRMLGRVYFPILETLTAALRCALKTEEPGEMVPPVPSRRVEDWDWRIPVEVSLQLEGIEKAILSEFSACRKYLAEFGILVNPQKCIGPASEWDMKKWEAHIPGLPNTPWEGGVYTLSLEWTSEKVNVIPRSKFTPNFFHPNVHPNGAWSLSGFLGLPEYQRKLDYDRRADNDYFAKSVSVDPDRLIKYLQDMQLALARPNLCDPAQSEAYTLAKNVPVGYDSKVREQAKQWKPHPVTGLAGRAVFRKP